MLPLERHLMTLKGSQCFRFTIQFSILSHLGHPDSDQTMSFLHGQCLHPQQQRGLTWGTFMWLTLLPVNTKFQLLIWGVRIKETNQETRLEKPHFPSFPRDSFSQIPSSSFASAGCYLQSLGSTPALPWGSGSPSGLSPSPVWLGCGPSGLSLPQLCPPLTWSTSFQLCPNNVSCIFQGVPAPCSCPSLETWLGWGAVGSPGCLQTISTLKLVLVTETDKHPSATTAQMTLQLL